MKPVPAGAGLAIRRVRLAVRDVVVLGGILGGEDHLASIHGERAEPGGRTVVALVTPEVRARELDAWLEELAVSLDLERL